MRKFGDLPQQQRKDAFDLCFNAGVIAPEENDAAFVLLKENAPIGVLVHQGPHWLSIATEARSGFKTSTGRTAGQELMAHFFHSVKGKTFYTRGLTKHGQKLIDSLKQMAPIRQRRVYKDRKWMHLFELHESFKDLIRPILPLQ